MQMNQLITDENRDDITAFVDDMNAIAKDLPTNSEGMIIDNDCSGAYLERTLFTGVTLVLDWAYLDAPSTAIVVDKDALAYDRDDETDFVAVGELYDQLDSELGRLIDADEIVFDESNSTEAIDVWHIHGVEPF